jgi:hypothetical protein
MKPHWLKLQDPIEADFWRELAAIEAEAELHAESLGWLPLEPGAYLHVSDENATEVLVVGVPQAGAAVLLVV